MGGGNREPKIIEYMEETNNIGISVHPFSHAKEFDGKISEDVSPCLRATDYKAPHCVWEEAKVINPLKGKTDKSWFFEQQVYDENGIARAIKSTDGSGNVPKVIINKTDSDMEKEKSKFKLPKELEGKKFRIRKLTPTECLRLQDVDDVDIKKMIDSGLSNSALYRLAGNSITISPLYHLFRKLFIETQPEYGEQLMLF